MSKAEKSKILFDSDEEEEVGFKTNEKYAKHYMEFRKKEILSHGELKTTLFLIFINNQKMFKILVKNLEDESSSDDDASTDEELVNPEFDEEFFKTMAFLKNKDPTKYQEIPSFFENVQPVEDAVKAKQKKEKIVTVADHQRERLLKTGGVMSDDEDNHNPGELSYTAEQEKIRNDLKKALNDSDDEESFFKVREKHDEELISEQVDYEKWLKSQNSKEIKPLKDFWTNNTLSKEDKFLRDYILKQRFISKNDEENEAIQQDIIGLSDDEAELEKQTEYEHKYNFRFEEPDNEFIKRFPRVVEDSVRVEKSKRKEQRKEREERKAKEKELKMKELRELQNIRKREIEEKLLLLKDVAGNDNLHEILQEDDLNSDFDPDEHDKRMSKIFNDDYYGIDEGDQKPEFPDIDAELNVENWDNFDKTKIANDYDEEQPHCEDDDFNMDCDYDPEEEKKLKLQNELIEMSKGRKRKKKISKLAELIKREKPAYDTSLDKTYAEYLDEYYALDYEDIIGDQPCRFKYTECVPNDFGLSVEEILMASNKELNQWASLKVFCLILKLIFF
jgi:protein KRI1